MRKGLTVLFLATLAMSANSAFSQANVQENEPATIYVDSANGTDVLTAGSSSRPLRTLSAAVAQALNNNAHGLGTHVMVAPGTYRESLDINGGSQTSAPITIEASQTGSSVISGSDQMSNWYHSSGSVYGHAWPYTTAACPIPNNWPSNLPQIVRRREMIFVNGNALTQVLSRASMREGTFYLDTGSRQVFIWPGQGTNVNSANIEVAARPTTLNIIGRNNVVVRGLTLTHAASCVINNGANVFSSSNVLIDRVQANWNNWGGLGISNSTNVTVQNSVANNNGGLGINWMKDKNATLQYSEADYNNWRGNQGGFYDFGMGGSKFMLTHGATVNQFYAYHNLAQGLWFDTDNRQINVTNTSLIGNGYANLQVEANQGPISLSHSLICAGSNGINLLTSENFSVSYTRFYNNGGSKNQAQFFLGGNPGGRSFRDWETGQNYLVYSENVSLSHNVLQDAVGSQWVFATYTSGSNWEKFRDTLSSNDNQWYDPYKSNAFDLPASDHVNLNGWRSSVRQDYSSSWSNSPGLESACYATPPNVLNLAVQVTSPAANLTYAMKNAQVAVPLTVKSDGKTAVKLETDKLPQGVSATVTSAAKGGPATLTVKATKQAVPETVPVTVIAEAGHRTTTLTVNVAVDPGN